MRVLQVMLHMQTSDTVRRQHAWIDDISYETCKSRWEKRMRIHMRGTTQSSTQKE